MPPNCHVCGDLEDYCLDIPVLSLAQSSEGGCQSCSILKTGLSKVIENIDQVEKLQLVVDVSLFVNLVGKDKETTFPTIEFYTLAGHPVSWTSIGPARHISANSSSDECIALAKKWLKGCLSSHPDCRRLGPPQLPTRVIEVGKCDEETKIYVSDPEVRAEYAALSHCWGGSHPVVLLKSNLAAMQQRLVLDDTSKTFKEAISITRRLGIPYLWIDSLCILQDQDDKADWSNEAPKMSAVYNGATVTISAASSVNTAGGLFPKVADREGRNESFEIEVVHPDGKPSSSVFVRAWLEPSFDLGETVHSSAEVEIPHLRSRGWVLQEDYLSPRILHFRKEELAWTCSTYTSCECRIRPSPPIPHPFRAASGTIQEAQKPELSRELGIRWPSIVAEYSRRNLTQLSDRIAALAGIATYAEECTTDSYYCGMWYEDLAFQLLWFVERRDMENPDSGPQSRFESPYAPSWSWMSVPAPISYYERYPAGSAPGHSSMRTSDAVEPLALVINVGRIPYDWENQVGPLIMAPLFLITRILPVRYNPATREWEAGYEIEDFASSNLRVNVDVDSDDPHDSAETEYFFILAGRWVGQGMTIACMQAVCIVARRLSGGAAELTWLAREFQRRLGGRIGSSEGGNDEEVDDDEDPNMPNPSNSYERVGLVRGAGSLEAWDKAGVPAERCFLF